MDNISRQLIIGTSGHIDHGKTSLIKALTGIDCDTHKQEKTRGITINLGFAHIKHPAGYNIGIVDVPGHKDFIDTMVAGASAINFALLVIAADSGIMPQTVEHLKILELLNVRKGIIVLTKIDLVDPLLLELAEEEVNDYISSTLLKGSPVVKVSCKTGYGIEKLKFTIFNYLDNNITDQNYYGPLVVPSSADAPFRMFIDRSFSMTGKGTVITGSILNGKVSKDDKLYLLPSDESDTIRIKEIQTYGEEVESASYGSRVALNIKTDNRFNTLKGKLVANCNLTVTDVLDAEITLFREQKTSHRQQSANWLHATFLSGSHETQAKIHLLFEENISTYLCQVHLETPCVLRFSDRFILRKSSGDETIGGGVVLDSCPLKHRKRTDKLRKTLSEIVYTGFNALLVNEVKKHLGLISSEEISKHLNFSCRELVENIIPDKLPRIKIININDDFFLLVENRFNNLTFKNITKFIKQFHKLNPLLQTGLTFDELLNKLDLEKYNAGKAYLNYLLEDLKKKKLISYFQGTWIDINHAVVPDSDLENNISYVDSLFKSYEMTAPIISQVEEECRKNQISSKELKQILIYLNASKKLYRVEDTYIHADTVDSCRSILIDYLKKHSEGITVAGFRDITKGNRKICLLMLAIFDREKTTLRKGDIRILNN